MDHIKSGKIDLVINTPLGRRPVMTRRRSGSASVQHAIPCITTLSGAAAAVNAIRALQREKLTVRSLQEYHGQQRETALRTRPA